MKVFDHDPDAELDYGRNWASWLRGDTLASSTWTVPEGLTELTVPAASFTDTTTTIWLSGGTPGVTYTVTNHITTAAGRKDDRSFQLRVIER